MGARAGFAQQPGRVGQFGSAKRLPGQGVVGGGNQRQFVVQPGDDFQLGVLARPFYQAKIHGEGQHGGDDVAGVGHMQAQPAIRLLAAQRRQALWQQVIGDGGAGHSAGGARRRSSTA